MSHFDENNTFIYRRKMNLGSRCLKMDSDKALKLMGIRTGMPQSFQSVSELILADKVLIFWGTSKVLLGLNWLFVTKTRKNWNSGKSCELIF